jgi:RimJ/RimL family protein N-acetyltransferase
VIETPRLRLRPWRGEDLDAYAAMNANPEVRRYMSPARPLTREESAREIEGLVEPWSRLGFGYWAVELRETGELIGRTGAKRHTDWGLDPENTEVGWLYARSAWGRGIATEGAIAAVRFCLEELGRPEVISIAALDNLASHRVMKKAGLEWAGVRRWYKDAKDPASMPNLPGMRRISTGTTSTCSGTPRRGGRRRPEISRRAVPSARSRARVHR